MRAARLYVAMLVPALAKLMRMAINGALATSQLETTVAICTSDCTRARERDGNLGRVRHQLAPPTLHNLAPLALQSRGLVSGWS